MQQQRLAGDILPGPERLREGAGVAFFRHAQPPFQLAPTALQLPGGEQADRQVPVQRRDHWTQFQRAVEALDRILHAAVGDGDAAE